MYVSSIRALLPLKALNDKELYQMEVVPTFLNDHFLEDVYVEVWEDIHLSMKTDFDSKHSKALN